MNTNPRCPRCNHQTFGAGQWCQNHGDQADYGPVYVSEKSDTWAVDGRYPDGRPNQHPKWAEERPLPGFEDLVNCLTENELVWEANGKAIRWFR